MIVFVTYYAYIDIRCRSLSQVKSSFSSPKLTRAQVDAASSITLAKYLQACLFADHATSVIRSAASLRARNSAAMTTV